MWTDQDRYSLLTNHEDFKKKYCSQLTIDYANKEKIDLEDLRRTIYRLTELMPNMDHSSPNTYGDPLIITGRCKNNFTIHNPLLPAIPRIGLCGKNTYIYLWADLTYLESKGNVFITEPEMPNDQWVNWSHWTGESKRNKGQLIYAYRYYIPVNIKNNNVLDNVHPFADNNVIGGALKKLNQFLVNENLSDPDFQNTRNDNSKAIYPKFTELNKRIKKS